MCGRSGHVAHHRLQRGLPGRLAGVALAARKGDLAGVTAQGIGPARQQLREAVIALHQAHQDLAAYGMTKAALEMLAKSLVIELSPYKITVNTVAPGATLTERTLEDAEYTDTWSRITPMGRPATVEDVASAVLFLVSPVAGHITGQNLVVDGGWTAVSVSPY